MNLRLGGHSMAKNPITEVRATVRVCIREVDKMVHRDPSINRQDACEQVLTDIEGGALTFDINQEYDRLTEQMRSNNHET